jgi:hypothetical protein
MANDRLRAEYGSCLSPETLEAVLDLISALRGIITPDPLCLEIIEAVQTGMQLWIEDEQFVLSEQEFNDGVSSCLVMWSSSTNTCIAYHVLCTRYARAHRSTRRAS